MAPIQQTRAKRAKGKKGKGKGDCGKFLLSNLPASTIPNKDFRSTFCQIPKSNQIQNIKELSTNLQKFSS